MCVLHIVLPYYKYLLDVCVKLLTFLHGRVQVYGDDRVPMSDVLSGLVQPLLNGKVDMAMVEYSDKVGP